MWKIYNYLKDSGIGVGGAMLDVGAGLGLRTYQLMPFCSSYYSFDADPRMVDVFNAGLLDRRKRCPSVDIRPMFVALAQEVEASGFDSIFMSDVASHFGDDLLVQLLRQMGTRWLRQTEYHCDKGTHQSPRNNLHQHQSTSLLTPSAQMAVHTQMTQGQQTSMDPAYNNDYPYHLSTNACDTDAPVADDQYDVCGLHETEVTRGTKTLKTSDGDIHTHAQGPHASNT